MNDLGNKYALAALKDKRATLAGEIADLKKQVAWRIEALSHVDASLHLLDPQANPNGIPLKRPRRRVKLFRQGELGNLIRDALRRAGKPVGLKEIVTALLEAGGHGESARAALTPRVRGNLAYLEKAGTVSKTGQATTAKWHLT
ncbi:MAG TPA: hypothetical protein VGU69_18430 [Rhizomicrobium sp.]|nr:hypothetical protein [Rhizomicrobium sp.]